MRRLRGERGEELGGVGGEGGGCAWRRMGAQRERDDWPRGLWWKERGGDGVGPPRPRGCRTQPPPPSPVTPPRRIALVQPATASHARQASTLPVRAQPGTERGCRRAARPRQARSACEGHTRTQQPPPAPGQERVFFWRPVAVSRLVLSRWPSPCQAHAIAQPTEWAGGRRVRVPGGRREHREKADAGENEEKPLASRAPASLKGGRPALRDKQEHAACHLSITQRHSLRRQGHRPADGGARRLGRVDNRGRRHGDEGLVERFELDADGLAAAGGGSVGGVDGCPGRGTAGGGRAPGERGEGEGRHGESDKRGAVRPPTIFISSPLPFSARALRRDREKKNDRRAREHTQAAITFLTP